MDDKLFFTMIALVVTLFFQAVVQLVVATKKTNGAEALKELIEAIAELQKQGQKDIQNAYPPDKFMRMHDRVVDIHGVVVTGDRRGAIPQTKGT